MPLPWSLEVRGAWGNRLWGHLFIMEKSFSAHSGKAGRKVSKSKIRGWRKGGSPYQVTSYEGSWPQKLWPLSQTGRGWWWLQKGQQDICIDPVENMDCGVRLGSALKIIVATGILDILSEPLNLSSSSAQWEWMLTLLDYFDDIMFNHLAHF